ncbi:hypothetical protein [Acetobacterium bakii]|uniref:Uncharacterized protein n=1 Tax=Acetobacterium bakii TaxID=52689 RepID=A0A0L6TYP7_9FIRM|nr:hypothetical protein [Acetobacterium bakii]KNZ41379.1 hypothetical protein AKG39_12215 [Acetobacterium bakii]
MSHFIDFEDPECAIKIEWSEKFIQLATQVGNLIRSLPLDNKQNDDLIKLVIDQVTKAEANAFIRGFHLAVEFITQGPTEDPKHYSVQ